MGRQTPHEGDRDFGVANKPLEMLSGFPDLFKQSVKEAQTLPQTFIPTLRLDLGEPVGPRRVGVVRLFQRRRRPQHRLVEPAQRQVGTVGWSLPTRSRQTHWRIHHPLLLEDRSVVSFITNRARCSVWTRPPRWFGGKTAELSPRINLDAKAKSGRA